MSFLNTSCVDFCWRDGVKLNDKVEVSNLIQSKAVSCVRGGGGLWSSGPPHRKERNSNKNGEKIQSLRSSSLPPPWLNPKRRPWFRDMQQHKNPQKSKTFRYNWQWRAKKSYIFLMRKFVLHTMLFLLNQFFPVKIQGRLFFLIRYQSCQIKYLHNNLFEHCDWHLKYEKQLNYYSKEKYIKRVF